MEINKQFWQQVKAEYEADNFYCSYLCHASPTFKKVWWQPDEKNPDEFVPNKEIMSLGKVFLAQNPELVKRYSLTIEKTVLFASLLENTQFVKQSRIPFLEWVIKQ
jgi:hypothetical protein